MPDLTGGLLRNVKVRMYFGKSEVRIHAVESVHTTLYRASIEFGGDGITFASAPRHSTSNQGLLQAQKHHM